VVGTAARRLYYWASQLPMVIPVAAVFLCSEEHVSRLLGVAILIYFGVMTALHRDVHTLMLSQVTLRQQNDLANARLSYEAAHDALTGLANRATFVDQVNGGFASTDGDSLIGILYIDRDRFKVVNNSLGHAAGDELLVSAALRMRDVLSDLDVLARFGGDEFTILLLDLESESAAITTATVSQQYSRNRSNCVVETSTCPQASVLPQRVLQPATHSRCSPTPMPRSTAQSRRVATASRSSTLSFVRRWSGASMMNNRCGERSTTARSWPGTNRSSTSPQDASLALKR